MKLEQVEVGRRFDGASVPSLASLVELDPRPARVHLRPAKDARGALTCSDTAPGGGVEARDLVAATEPRRGRRFGVALVEQPYRSPGAGRLPRRRSSTPRGWRWGWSSSAPASSAGSRSSLAGFRPAPRASHGGDAAHPRCCAWPCRCTARPPEISLGRARRHEGAIVLVVQGRATRSASRRRAGARWSRCPAITSLSTISTPLRRPSRHGFQGSSSGLGQGNAPDVTRA